MTGYDWLIIFWISGVLCSILLELEIEFFMDKWVFINRPYKVIEIIMYGFIGSWVTYVINKCAFLMYKNKLKTQMKKKKRKKNVNRRR